MSDWAGRMEVLKPPSAPLRRITVKVTRQSRKSRLQVVADATGLVSHSGSAPLADGGRRLREHKAGLEQARADLGESALVAWESGASLNKLATAAGVTPEVIVTATMKAHRKRGTGGGPSRGI